MMATTPPKAVWRSVTGVATFELTQYHAKTAEEGRLVLRAKIEYATLKPPKEALAPYIAALETMLREIEQRSAVAVMYVRFDTAHDNEGLLLNKRARGLMRTQLQFNKANRERLTRLIGCTATVQPSLIVRTAVAMVMALTKPKNPYLVAANIEKARAWMKQTRLFQKQKSLTLRPK